MNNKLFITLATLALIIASCTKENLNIEPQPRVMHITATVEEPAATRATLEELTTGAIRFKWTVGDIIQMAFVQGDTKATANATITTVSADGRTAQFEFILPEGIDGDFTLYAYRSSQGSGRTEGSVLLSTNPVIAVLPKDPWSYLAHFDYQHYIVSMWDKKEVVYSGGDMPAVSLAFKHLGAMFTVKINNTTDVVIEDVYKLNFMGTAMFIRNGSGNRMAQFNMETGSYVEGKEYLNTNFNVNTNPGYSGSKMQPGINSYSQWIVPGPYKESNPITVDAINGQLAVIGTTTTTKNAIEFKPGYNYIVYLKISGTAGNYTLEYTKD